MSEVSDVRISPTLHPGLAGVVEDYDDDTRPLLGAAETAVDEAFKALQSIHDAKAGAAKNPTLNEYAQLVAVDTHATKVMSKVYGSWARTVDVLNSNIASMEKELNALWRGDLDEKFPSIRMRTDRRGFQVVPALIDAGKRYSQV
ncbi:hypothetical protein [Sphingobium baderi]|uniref:hypothetical protein n=1 Tax=Sphingobium baderi TaxID=1332080 RepID=UPI002B40C0F9|nr:hypothetical protein [Sphingobium baderi]WRD77499.1 hypothetical protein QQ987_05080 [Sphingobium baderi]